MRLAEREMIELDRKQQAIEFAHNSTATIGLPTATTTSTSSTTTTATTTTTAITNPISIEETITTGERMIELVKQIAEEARRLAATRADLQKAKKQQAELGEVEKSAKSSSTSNSNKKSKTQSSTTTSTSTPTASTTSTSNDAINSSTNDTNNEVVPHKGVQKMSVPESLIPELCR